MHLNCFSLYITYILIALSHLHRSRCVLNSATDNVEMEIVLPGDMTVRESHDIALELQHKIEGLEEVERAFVHVRDVIVIVILICDCDCGRVVVC